MKRFLFLLAIVLAAWAYGRHQAAEPEPQFFARPAAAAYPAEQAEPSGPSDAKFACEGKTHCTEMRSCEEAKYYLAHCPWPKMDGDGDGIPCEDQWCGH